MRVVEVEKVKAVVVVVVGVVGIKGREKKTKENWIEQKPLIFADQKASSAACLYIHR